MENYMKLPIQFEKMGNVVDDRFIKVKIWLAHVGENRNNSIFSKELLESMIPSLSLVPILGHLATNEEGITDFKGHEEKLIIDNGEFSFKYMGRAWGVIPEANNAHFETRYGEDGVEREYLVAEGVLWRKFPEVEEIFDRDSGYKNQSMELFPPSVKGYVNEQGQFVFTEAKFEGACILGEDVTPAMISSTIEKFSVANDLKAEFSEMLTEFNTHFSKTQEKGDDPVENENTPVVEPETPVVTEPEAPEQFENQEPVTPVTPDEPEVTATEPETSFSEPTENPEVPAEPETDFADNKDKEDEEDDKDKEDNKDKDDEEDEPKKFTLKFELSHDDIRYGLYNALESHDQFKSTWVWISQVFDNHAIIEDEDNGKFYKMNYVKHENAVSLGEFEEIFPMWVNSTEKQVIEIARNSFTQYEALEQEVKSLREFKASSELSEKESKLTSYSAVLSKEEYKAIQDNLSNFSITDLEKEIGFMLLKKNHFSATNSQEEPTRVSAVPAEDNFQYGTLSKYFTKSI